jgi:hypothetical protein
LKLKAEKQQKHATQEKKKKSSPSMQGKGKPDLRVGGLKIPR